ncbi:hypothetical protein PG993_002886 [Apiospora rasikravindrae]|uniref:Uncharacterized protein n=1 Tax=Apiospora rasikravindrae TaxID=990691 RepID=A0ABR1U027_9PEZI
MRSQGDLRAVSGLFVGLLPRPCQPPGFQVGDVLDALASLRTSDFQASRLVVVGLLLWGGLLIVSGRHSLFGIQRSSGGGNRTVGAQVVIEQDLASGALAEAVAELDVERGQALVQV